MCMYALLEHKGYATIDFLPFLEKSKNGNQAENDNGYGEKEQKKERKAVKGIAEVGTCGDSE